MEKCLIRRCQGFCLVESWSEEWPRFLINIFSLIYSHTSSWGFGVKHVWFGVEFWITLLGGPGDFSKHVLIGVKPVLIGVEPVWIGVNALIWIPQKQKEPYIGQNAPGPKPSSSPGAWACAQFPRSQMLGAKRESSIASKTLRNAWSLKTPRAGLLQCTLGNTCATLGEI